MVMVVVLLAAEINVFIDVTHKVGELERPPEVLCAGQSGSLLLVRRRRHQEGQHECTDDSSTAFDIVQSVVECVAHHLAEVGVIVLGKWLMAVIFFVWCSVWKVEGKWRE